MLLSFPVKVRHAEGAARVEPIVTATPVLPDRVLLVTDPERVVNCSRSSPEEALEDAFWQLLIVLPEMSNIRESIPLEA